MFYFITSSKLSHQKFEFLLKMKVMGLNPGYLLKSFVLYGLANFYSLQEEIHAENRDRKKYRLEGQKWQFLSCRFCHLSSGDSARYVKNLAFS